MSVTGLCQVCEARQATQQCPRCGALVCEKHYDAELGYCTQCATEIRAGRDRDNLLT